MFFSTQRSLVTMMSNPDSKKRCYWVTVSGKMAGAFLVSIDEEKYKNICVLDYTFKIEGDENLEKEIFKEVFDGLAKKKQMPVYFKADTLTDDTKELLRKIGAEETEDADEETIWYAEKNCKVFKLQ